MTVAGATRTEQYQGREHLVVPVIALVEGVVHAMNSAYPEFVSAKEFSRAPSGWNGRPVFLGHPTNTSGTPVSGNSPDILEEKSIGIIFNTRIKSKKLCMEAWIDVEKATEVAPDLLDRVAAGDDIQISVGVLVDTDDAEGVYQGKKYLGAWHDLVPDHLALLPASDAGACSWEMGCGVRAAAAVKENDMDHMYAEWLEAGAETDALLKTLRNIPQSERDKMPAEDFAGPNRSFPIQKAEDVSAAASSLGRAKGNKDAIKKKIISIAYRKGFEASLPEDWKKKKDQKSASSLLGKISAFLRTARSSEDQTANELKRELTDELRPLEPALICVEDYNPTLGWVVYSVSQSSGGYYGPSYALFQRAYTVDANGEVTINGDRVEVEIVTSYEPVDPMEDEEEVTAAAGKAISKKNAEKVQAMHDHAVALGAYCDPNKAMKSAAAAAPCSCHKSHAAKQAKESDMTKEAITKFLETATPEQVEALGKVIEAPAAAAVEQPKAAVEQPKAAAAAAVEQPKTPTFDEVLASADADTRASISEGIRVAKERKAATIKGLKDTKRCKLSDETLNAMSQAQLDELVELAGTTVRAAIDFSANAAHVDANAQPKEVPAAPALGDRIRAARGQVK